MIYMTSTEYLNLPERDCWNSKNPDGSPFGEIFVDQYDKPPRDMLYEGMLVYAKSVEPVENGKKTIIYHLIQIRNYCDDRVII